MYRMMRRAPWIALGAAGAYYLDGVCGPARRRRSATTLREWARGFGEQWVPAGLLAMAGGEPADDPPLTPSVPDDLVRTRAAEPLAEEQAAGVEEPAEAMAEQILEESEARVTDRAGTASEHRRSEDTVEPVD